MTEQDEQDQDDQFNDRCNRADDEEDRAKLEDYDKMKHEEYLDRRRLCES